MVEGFHHFRNWFDQSEYVNRTLMNIAEHIQIELEAKGLVREDLDVRDKKFITGVALATAREVAFLMMEGYLEYQERLAEQNNA